MMRKRLVLLSITGILLLIFFLGRTGLSEEKNKKVVIRAGHFPNITHSQGVIGQANGWFDKEIGNEASIDWKVFNAGPSAIEAMFAGELDLAYVGPNPAINGYVRSNGKALRIIAGATSGGAAFIVREDAGINTDKDFNGKRLASPQLGNTQDIALRIYLKEKGYKLKEKGGTVSLIPLANADQLTLFIKKEIDGAWAPEPWATRLIKEGKGKLFLDERERWPKGEFTTANLIVRTKFLSEHPDLVKKWLKAHIEITEWINKNKEEAKKVLNEEIKKETGKGLPAEVLNDSFARFEVTFDPIKSSLFNAAKEAFDLGFLGKKEPDLSGIYDLSILNGILKEKGLKEIQ